MELGAVRGFGLAPGTGPSAGLTSLQSTYPAVLHPSSGSACPSSALVVPLPRAAQPGQLNTWGPEAQKTGNEPPNHLCKFLEKKKKIFFFFFLRFVKTLSSHLYPSAHPLLPTLQSFIAIFFKTRRGCSPGSSEQGIVKSHNLSWMIL